MFEVVISKSARRCLTRMPAKTAQIIRGEIAAVAADPLAQHNNVTPLRGIEGFRLRVGDWRVLYQLDVPAQVLRITNILPRGGAYS
ncbi:MAG: type II toxin-antitoxin system RelE/ParE family toxin [Acidobacteriota bacterium]|nr:type II toxin-antitoxin system RelE/ParE family toxin [Acidobacteriota bacterium]